MCTTVLPKVRLYKPPPPPVRRLRESPGRTPGRQGYREHEDKPVKRLGFEGWGLGFRVWGLGFMNDLSQ